MSAPARRRGRLRDRAYRDLSRLADHVLTATGFVYLGLLWVVACVPVVTAPAATVAMIVGTRAWSRGDAMPGARALVAELRVAFVPRTVTMVLVLVLYAVLAVDLYAIGLMGSGRRLFVMGWLVVAMITAVLTVLVPVALADGSRGGVATVKRAATVALLRPHLAVAAVGVATAAVLVAVTAPLVVPVAGVGAAWCLGTLWDRATTSENEERMVTR